MSRSIFGQLYRRHEEPRIRWSSGESRDRTRTGYRCCSIALGDLGRRASLSFWYRHTTRELFVATKLVHNEADTLNLKGRHHRNDVNLFQ